MPSKLEEDERRSITRLVRLTPEEDAEFQQFKCDIGVKTHSDGFRFMLSIIRNIRIGK
jgi:hypothetical protein